MRFSFSCTETQRSVTRNNKDRHCGNETAADIQKLLLLTHNYLPSVAFVNRRKCVKTCQLLDLYYTVLILQKESNL